MHCCGRAVALDFRLARPAPGSIRRGKVAACTARRWRSGSVTRDFRSAQPEFRDQSRPKGGRGLQRLRGPKAVAVGDRQPRAPERELAVQCAPRGPRAGAVEIDGMMRVGNNVQTRLVALHRLDAPWRPCDGEQRKGRSLLRQGNVCEEAGTCLAFLWLHQFSGSIAKRFPRAIVSRVRGRIEGSFRGSSPKAERIPVR